MTKSRYPAFPYIVFMAIFIVIPLIMVTYFAFTTNTGEFTIQNIIRVGDYVPVIIKSLFLAFVATVICLGLGYPFAYIMSRKTSNIRRTMFMLIMLPMWMNFLLRTYSWMTILENNGLLNRFLGIFGIGPFEMINTQGAVVLGMVYDYLPFMIVPLYTVMMKMDHSLVQAAQDLEALSHIDDEQLIAGGGIDDVQAVDCQRLNHAAEGDDHGVRLTGFQNGLHHLAVIPFLIGRIIREQQLLNQRAHLPGHRLAHALARVLDRAHAADLHQAIDRQAIPLIRNHALLLEQRQLLIRIGDERGEHIPLMGGKQVAVQVVDLALDDAAGVMQDMQESLMLAMQIRKEMLRALGQVEDGLQVDDLRTGSLHRGILLCQKPQIVQLLGRKYMLAVHNGQPFPF